jgi:hypothetical protein
MGDTMCSALVLCSAVWPVSQVEARLARREEAKAREEDDLMAAPAVNIMGGDDSFAAAKAR